MNLQDVEKAEVYFSTETQLNDKMFKLPVSIHVPAADSALSTKTPPKFSNEYHIDKKTTFLAYSHFRVINISFMGLFWLSFCKKI